MSDPEWLVSLRAAAQGPDRPFRGGPVPHQCPGYPGGTCLTVIPGERSLCQFCKRTLRRQTQAIIERRTR
jgi:hypothetical protein